jgi:DNA polymerase-1
MVPGVREIAKKARSIAKSRGYVHTIFGRHIRFPGGNFTHKASGLVYQGSSADLVKFDIINTCDYLRQECPEGRLLLSIHDEQNVSIPLDGRERQHMDAIRDLIQSRPGSPTRLRVPIRADFSIPGKNWWEATNLGGIHG